VDPAALAALDANYLDASRIFMAIADSGEYVERQDVAISCCGLPAQALNFGFLKPPWPDPVATAEAVRDWFASRRLPFQLTFRDPDARRPARALEPAGWHASGDPMPGMTLALPAAAPPPPAGLAIRRVETPDLLVGYRETAFRGFGYPAAVAPRFMNERLFGLPQVRLFAGLVDDTVVATSMLIASGAVAGIYWVATLEEHRGRGYGEALTWAAVAGGREFGCRIASLQASKLGRPVYARMGFAHVLDYEHLLPPEPARDEVQ
jgi:hypothetical protein